MPNEYDTPVLDEPDDVVIPDPHCVLKMHQPEAAVREFGDNPDLATAPFVEGMASVATPGVEEYVRRCFNYRKKTVRNFLLWTETIYEAKKDLSAAEFKLFCDLVGIDPSVKGSLSRITTIGRKASVLLNHADRLPPHTSTIYKIAHLKDSKMMEVLHHDRLGPDCSAKHIDEIINEPQEHVSTDAGRGPGMCDEAQTEHGPRILLDLKWLGTSEREVVDSEIRDLEGRFGESLKVTRTGFPPLDAEDGFNFETASVASEAHNEAEPDDA
jgi:hypothetical protein